MPITGIGSTASVDPVASLVTALNTATAASLQKSNNLSDLVSASSARTNLGLGASAVMSTAQIAADSALTRTFLPLGVGYSELTEPIYVAHRGTPYTYPEHTMRGYRAAVASGAKALKIDVRKLADGALAVVHDTTTTRTFTTTSNVTAHTSATWKTLTPKTSTYLAPDLTGGTAPAITAVPEPLLLDEVLAEFGNRVVLMIEPKNSGEMADLVTALTRWEIRADFAILATFFSGDLTVAAATIYTPMFNLSTASGANWASLYSQGARLVAVQAVQPPTAATLVSADVAAAQAAGLKVYPWTINRRSVCSTLIGWGANGIITNDYAWVTGSTTAPVGTTDFFALQTFPPGCVPDNVSGDRGGFPAATTFGWTATTNDTRTCLMGYLSPMKGSAAPTAVTINLSLKINAVNGGDTTRYAGIFVGDTDGYFANSGASGQGINGFMAFMDAAGTIKLRTIVDGAASGGDSTAATSAVTLGTTVAQLRLTITSTTVTWARIDVAGSAAKTLSTPRGGYLQLFRVGSSVEFSGITVS
jgi:glycerophosphoryl diester phosphodiesterase